MIELICFDDLNSSLNTSIFSSIMSNEGNNKEFLKCYQENESSNLDKIGYNQCTSEWIKVNNRSEFWESKHTLNEDCRKEFQRIGLVFNNFTKLKANQSDVYKSLKESSTAEMYQEFLVYLNRGTDDSCFNFKSTFEEVVANEVKENKERQKEEEKVEDEEDTEKKQEVNSLTEKEKHSETEKKHLKEKEKTSSEKASTGTGTKTNRSKSKFGPILNNQKMRTKSFHIVSSARAIQTSK